MVMPRCLPDAPCGWNGPGVVRTSSDIRAELANRVVRYEVTETFRNLGGGLGEADYLFPLPSGAAFQDLQLSIDGEMVAGETMGAQEARGVYEEIVRRRRDPALVEWMGYGLLRARIFPIAAGDEKRVVVRFQTVAPREGDAVRIDYLLGGPNSAAPGIRPIALIRPVMRWEGDLPSDRWTFTLSYPSVEGYGPAYSPTHSITTEDTGERRVVHASGTGRDLTILLPVARREGASVAVLPYAPGGTDGYALITVTPPAVHEVATPRDVTFVIDVSGSMSGRKIDQARGAGRQLLATLTARDRFRMIDFSTDVRTFRDDFVCATPEHVREAEKYLDQLQADGSTNLAGALAVALAPPPGTADARGEDAHDAARLRLLLLVTDGEPTVGERNPDAIVAHAVQDLQHTRIFTFGLGADVNAPLLEQLALQGHGTAQFMGPDESVERAVSLVAQRLTNPVVTDLTVSTDGVHLEHTSPDGPVDLFAGQDLVLLTRYRGAGHAQLHFTGHSASGPVAWTSAADFPDRDRANAFVARLWATQRIGYLAAERRRSGPSSEVDAEIKSLGEEYGIPTEFTAYLVQEPTPVALRPGRLPDDYMIAPAAPMRGTVGGASPSAQAFEAAKAAAGQRSATSLAMVDAAAAPASGAVAGSVRQAGDRTLVWRDSVWMDTRYRDGVRVVRIAPYSAAYFALLDAIADLRPAFAVADRIQIAGRAVAIEVTPAGVAQLDAGDVAAIRAAW
jgi:Ca-activated chloride channel family protein